ncbi:MAG: hypothetical protein Q8J69_03555 [Sphingobacteriaceae bacterium]|nr:hypothetical protein [Sphingobacteriaceae bacterium]
MNNQFNKIDWPSYGYANLYFGVPVLLFGLSLETISATTQFLIWLPFAMGIIILLLTDRQELLKFIFPFAAKSGRGMARYLGVVGLLTYTSGRVLPEGIAKAPFLLNAGLLLVAASAAWYMIRLVRFQERGL